MKKRPTDIVKSQRNSHRILRQSLDVVPDHRGSALVDELPEQFLEAVELPVHELPPGLGAGPGQLVQLHGEAALRVPPRHLLEVHAGGPMVSGGSRGLS